MYPNRSEHSHRRQHADRGPRHRDDYDDRWEERHEPHRDAPRDKYGGNGHSNAERVKRTGEYSDSPKRPYGKESSSRDWGRKSPLRRSMPSPDWGAAEKKRRRFTEDDEDDYRGRREPVDKAYSQSPDTFSHFHAPKDFKHTAPQEEDFRYRKTAQDSRHRHRKEEFTHRKQPDDFRLLSGYYKDRDRHERSWDRSEDGTRSQERPTKSCGKPRERDDSPSTEHEEHHHSRARFPLYESVGQSLESDAAGPQQQSTNGFQRFLDVLNKGVNVATLTKIVTQSAAEAGDRAPSPVSLTNAPDCLWSPGPAGRRRGSQQHDHHWSESEGSQRRASPQPQHRSFSPRGSSLPDEKSLQRKDGGQSYHSSDSRSRSPSVAGKTPMTPEDEHKHRQMQNVLQAIGMDLGVEELGQMSHRIQERLYGKRDGDWGPHRRGSRETDTWRAFSPRRQSRSSSSNRSNFSPVAADSYLRNESCTDQRDATDPHQAAEYGQSGSSSSSQDACETECDANSQEITAASQTPPPTPVYSLPQPPLTSVLPAYSPVSCPPLPYAALPPVLPPNLPHVGPRLFLPRLPPVLPYPHLSPLNMFPAVLAQTRHLLPQHISNPQLPFFNLPDISPAQPLNTAQKSKTQPRPRCLQVIETKQPG